MRSQLHGKSHGSAAEAHLREELSAAVAVAADARRSAAAAPCSLTPAMPSSGISSLCRLAADAMQEVRRLREDSAAAAAAAGGSSTTAAASASGRQQRRRGRHAPPTGLDEAKHLQATLRTRVEELERERRVNAERAPCLPAPVSSHCCPPCFCQALCPEHVIDGTASSGHTSCQHSKPQRSV